jgi:hypothetical protein
MPIKCPVVEHEMYFTRGEAEAELKLLVADIKRHGRGGKSWKRLNVFACGNHFHVGRANGVYKPPAAPVQKTKTTGQRRREEQKLEKDNARHARHNMRQAGWEVDSLEIAADRAKDYLDSIQHAIRMRDELFAGKRQA